MTLCTYHTMLLKRTLSLLGDDCFYPFRDALISTITAHYQHHCPKCQALKEEKK